MDENPLLTAIYIMIHLLENSIVHSKTSINDKPIGIYYIKKCHVGHVTSVTHKDCDHGKYINFIRKRRLACQNIDVSVSSKI